MVKESITKIKNKEYHICPICRWITSDTRHPDLRGTYTPFEWCSNCRNWFRYLVEINQ